MSLDSLVIVYWSLRDPLCESQALPVLRGLARDGYKLGLMTFEQKPWRLAPRECREATAELKRQGIEWLPRRYHARPKGVSTILDVIGAAVRARRTKARLLHGRGSVPAAIAFMATRGTPSLFLNDADGPLSQEYVDAGIWKRGSRQARFVGRLECLFLDRADANVVLTTRRAKQVERPGRAAPVVVPCAVESEMFVPRPVDATGLRRDLSLDGTVFVYAGKIGGWYLVEPMMDFVAAYQDLGEAVTLLVLTTQPPEPFLQLAASRKIRCRVHRATREQMPSYLSTAQAGLSFILPAPSKEACSPIKNGEYLACGLPIITTAGIGDYSAIVASQRVGVVVDSIEGGSLVRAAQSLRALLDEPSLAQRCREAARNHAGLSEVVLPRYRALYRQLLRPAAMPADWSPSEAPS